MSQLKLRNPVETLNCISSVNNLGVIVKTFALVQERQRSYSDLNFVRSRLRLQFFIEWFKMIHVENNLVDKITVLKQGPQKKKMWPVYTY